MWGPKVGKTFPPWLFRFLVKLYILISFQKGYCQELAKSVSELHWNAPKRVILWYLLYHLKLSTLIVCLYYRCFRPVSDWKKVDISWSCMLVHIGGTNPHVEDTVENPAYQYTGLTQLISIMWCCKKSSFSWTIHEF